MKNLSNYNLFGTIGGLLLWPSTANVAFPGIWTGLQPNGETTGTEQVLIGTPEYHYAVVETSTSFYPTIRGSDGRLTYATMGSDGRYLPTDVLVGSVDPDDESSVLEDALEEKKHAIHAQCMEKDYCRWKAQQKALASLGSPATASTGKLSNLVIAFQFADHAENGRILTTTEDLNQYLFNGEVLSVKDYFYQQSYGKLELYSEVATWVTIPYTEAQCADGQSGLSRTLHTCLEEALQQASYILADWNTLINSITTLTFVHSGYSAEYGGHDEDGTWYQDRIWSHAWELETSLYSGRYALISDKYDRNNAHMNRVGAAVHELAQVMGAPALYGEYPGYGLGYYDMLANPWGFAGTLTYCGSMSPYTKNLLGWMQVEEINSDGTYELPRSFDNDIVYVIRRGFPDGEYWMLENRAEKGYDLGLSQPGLAIYHVDEQANDMSSHPMSEHAHYPKDHYRVALVQADGRFDLERMEDEGDSGDLFHGGRFTGVGPTGAILDDGSILDGGHPNSNSYQGGDNVATGIVISDISVADEVMTFHVAFT